MKFIVLIGGIIAVAAVIAVLLRIPLMRIPPPDEYVPQMARQELLSFHLGYSVFKDRHGKAPDSVQELLAQGNYLKGVVEPHRTKILRNLKYPVVADSVSAANGTVLAAYHVAGFGDFFLMTNGSVVERRLRDYEESSFWHAQEREDELIARQRSLNTTSATKP